MKSGLQCRRFVGLRLFISFEAFSCHLGFAKRGELERVKEGKEGVEGGEGLDAPSLQCFPNPRWRLINTRWNIQRSLAQNTPVLQAR